jgi:uncharacterized protein YecE (DUF72 family)
VGRRVWVGCCGLPVARERYDAELSVAELNSPFYRLPSVATARRWRDELCAGRIRCMKVWQAVTHPASSPTYRRLGEDLPGDLGRYGLLQPTEEVRGAWQRTLEVAQALRPRFLVLQLPPAFAPTRQAKERLAQALACMSRDVAPVGAEIVWEVRGSWTLADVEEVAQWAPGAPVADPLAYPQAMPRTPRGAVYARLHGRREGGRIVYGHAYQAEELDRLEAWVDKALGEGAAQVYLLFNNRTMWEDALRMEARVRTRGWV